MKKITVQQFHSTFAEDDSVELIDVRTPGEFESVRMPGARLAPLDNLDCSEFLAARAPNANNPIYITCHSGMRAAKAAERFAKAGFDNCILIEGGTEAWKNAGFDVVRGESKVLPLPRQMQTIMGSLILVGVILSVVVNAAWIWLAGFIGAGLLMAGLTDFCPLRTLLAKAPWNRGTESRAGSSKSCCVS